MSLMTYLRSSQREARPLVWLHGEIKTPPMGLAARLEAGYLLRKVQQGEVLGLPHSRPMPVVGDRCHELRIQDRQASWRVFYRIDREAILILDVVQKQTQATPQEVLETCRQRAIRYDRLMDE